MTIKFLGDVGSDGDVELKDEESASSTLSKTHDGSWVNNALRSVKLPLICKIPQKIVIMMRTVEAEMCTRGMAGLEFGAHLKGTFTSDGYLLVGEDIWIGKQKVSGASIDFEEDPPDATFNGVIHRHPTGCNNFSGTDDTFINQNHMFSLLYVNNVILLGVTNIDIVNGPKIQVPLKVEIIYPIFRLDIDNIISKIQRHQKLLPPAERRSESDGSDDLFRFIKKNQTGNPLFEDSEEGDETNLLGDEDEDEGKDVAGENYTEEDLEGLYLCQSCGNLIQATEFPARCDSCDKMVGEEDLWTVDVDDLQSLEPDMLAKIKEIVKNK